VNRLFLFIVNFIADVDLMGFFGFKLKLFRVRNVLMFTLIYMVVIAQFTVQRLDNHVCQLYGIWWMKQVALLLQRGRAMLRVCQ